LKWPLLNSDEGTMGIMALHIAYRGEHPIFYYGQQYMGSLEAYIGAGLFHVFGPSILTLRFGIILLYIPFLIAMYFLTSMLYTKGMALGTLVLLSLGSIPILILEMSPIGGYPEILFFGATAFLLASWLTLSYDKDVVEHRHWLRLFGYTCWGCVSGLAIWSDPLILPYLISALLLLVVFCWREMIFQLGGICLLLGLVIGAYPFIMYNLRASPGQDSITILLGKVLPPTSTHGSFTPLSKHVINTMLYHIPTATGNPLCPLVFSQGPVNTPGLRCAFVHASWSLGFIVLWLLAFFLAIMTLWRLKHSFHEHSSSSEQKRAIICEFAHLMLLVSAGLTVLFFILSASSIPSSAGNARYLHCLLISLPAFIWPLWTGGTSLIEPSEAFLVKLKVVLSSVMLVLIFVVFLAGTLAAFFDIHTVRSIELQHDAVIQKLESMHIKHFYTDDYWTCYRIAFASRERVTCATIGSHLLLKDDNRYWPYVLQVQADPHAAYVLPLNDPETPVIVRNAHLANGKYLRSVLYGYVIYKPW
jgi:hypothetical protein